MIRSTESKETSRIEAFSDGVFAIAITLLVLELITTLHGAGDEKLMQTLFHHWQSFLAFVIGFVTILVCWVNHHIAMEYIHRVDTGFMWVNGFLLFLVTLTPFPTAILAGYLGTEPETALAIYGINYALISLAAFAICHYAYRRHLIEPEHREFFASFKIIYWYAIFFNLLATGLCFVSVFIPALMYTVLFMSFASPRSLVARVQQWQAGRKKGK